MVSGKANNAKQWRSKYEIELYYEMTSHLINILFSKKKLSLSTCVFVSVIEDIKTVLQRS